MLGDMKTKHHTFRFFLTAGFIGLLIPASAAGNESFEKTLWQKAVDHYTITSEWKAGTLENISQEFNRKGELKKSGSLHFMLDTADLPELSYLLVEASENGRDITEKSRKTVESQENGAGFVESFFINPFAPDPVTPPRYAPVPGRRGVYSFTMIQEGDQGDPLTFSGTVQLDPDSGEPRRIACSVVDPPKMLKSMEVEVLYASENSSPMLPHRIRMEMQLKLLLMEKHVKIETRFSDWFHLPSLSRQASHD
jgi:hypothetical protein